MQQPDPKETETSSEFVDEATDTRMIVDSSNPDYPGHPKITVIYPGRWLSLEEMNAALSRLRDRAGVTAEEFPDLTPGEYRR